MNQRTPKITAASVTILRMVGEEYSFVIGIPAITPPGAQALMQHGYIVRLGMDRAQITPTGRAFLAGLDWEE